MPTLVKESELEETDTRIKAKEGEEFSHILSKLFRDEDGEKLNEDG